MITLARDDLRALIAEARLAPSVHNIQPTRWRMADGAVELLGEPARAIPHADPAWRDWRLSHGAALEGLAIALAARGLTIANVALQPAAILQMSDATQSIARITLASTTARTPIEPIATRASWRGTFKPLDAEISADLDRLAAGRDDITLIRGADALKDTADLADRAGLYFLRDDAHREELRAWLRLSRSHANYHRDGLNAEAMSLSAVEAWGASLVLGPLFKTLDRIGVAAPLVSERVKTKSSSAVVLFHRPRDEDAVHSGRAFYRAWLDMERLGLKGCPMSVLADWPEARESLAQRYKLSATRQIVSVFRVGRPNGTPKLAHARLHVDELLA